MSDCPFAEHRVMSSRTILSRFEDLVVSHSHTIDRGIYTLYAAILTLLIARWTI